MSKINDYVQTRISELVGDEECAPVGDYIEIIANEVRNKFNVQCETCYCGGFDSPGYDISCYAMAWINEEGQLEVTDFQQESY